MAETTTAVATTDAKMAAILAGMVRKEDMGDDAPQIPVLKINYDPESMHPRGAWVVGQQKDSDGNITDEGQIVNGLVILMIKRRYSYYNQNDTKQNCSSPIFNGGETVCGSKYGYNCKSGECPKRDRDLNPNCKAQWVVFGTAVTASNTLVDCMSYIQGASYMPFDEHRNSITKLKSTSGYVTVPPFSFITLLGSKKEKNKGTIYFVAQFTRGKMFAEEQLRAFADKREDIDGIIEAFNSRLPKPGAAPAAPAGAPPAGPATMAADPNVITVTPIPMEDDIPFNGAGAGASPAPATTEAQTAGAGADIASMVAASAQAVAAGAAVPEQPPVDPAAAIIAASANVAVATEPAALAGNDSDFDIEAAIAAALNK